MTESPDAQVLDGAALAALLAMVGDDPEFLGELVSDFLADAPGQIAAMDQAIAEGDIAALVPPAHTLKGAAASLGGHEVEALCRRLEALARSGDVRGAAPLVRDVGPCMARLAASLDAARARGWRA